jgi:hypothetical protein
LSGLHFAHFPSFPKSAPFSLDLSVIRPGVDVLMGTPSFYINLEIEYYMNSSFKNLVRNIFLLYMTIDVKCKYSDRRLKFTIFKIDFKREGFAEETVPLPGCPITPVLGLPFLGTQSTELPCTKRPFARSQSKPQWFCNSHYRRVPFLPHAKWHIRAQAQYRCNWVAVAQAFRSCLIEALQGLIPASRCLSPCWIF